MTNVYEQRRENLRRLQKEWGGPTSLAKKLGHSNGSYLAQLIGPNPSRDVRWLYFMVLGALAFHVVEAVIYFSK